MTDPIQDGTSEVFADLGLPDPADRRTKTRLAMQVNAILKSRGLRQVAAAGLLGVPQSKVSALANYRLDQFSVEKLMTFLNRLDCDVDIIIRPRREALAATSVMAQG